MSDTPHITIKTAYYKAQGLFTVRAYATDGVSKDAFATATEENLADASTRAIKTIQDTYRSEGLRVPQEVLPCGRHSRLAVDGWYF